MSRSRGAFIAVGFVGGLAAGTLLWSRMQRQYRRNLFSRSPLMRVAALGYLRAKPSVNTAQILREYIAWEPRPILRQRGARMLRHLEATL
jgi:predicted component of type VI protein secretion system